ARKSFCARASTAAPSAGASWQKVTGTGEITCSATPSASMSASRLPADQQRLSMCRYGRPPTRMRASVSLLCSTEGQYAQGAMAARSGKDGAMAWVCRSTSPLRAGPGAVTAAGGTAVSRLGTAATTCAPPRSLVLRRPAHKSIGRFQKCQWYDQNRVTGILCLHTSYGVLGEV